MPQVFDRATVTRLIEGIDQPYNADILKVGYFLRRGEPALSTNEGYALLKTAAEKEPIGTRRWFRLRNLQAAAAFQTPGVSLDEGFDAYNLIFEHAAEAADSKAGYPLRQAILEYVTAIPGKLHEFGLNDDPRTRRTLLRAWRAYLTALETPLPKGSRIGEPPWTQAIKRSYIEHDFALEKSIQDEALPPNIAAYMAAAGALSQEQPDKALDFYQKGKAFLPKPTSPAEANTLGRFYDAWVVLLREQDRIKDAIAAQQERAALLGDGQARLLFLLRRGGNEAEFQRLFAEMCLPNASEQEIVKGAEALLALSTEEKAPDAKAGEQGAALLHSYLFNKRTRSLESELQARASLANYLVRHQRWDDVRDVLAASTGQRNVTPQAQIYLQRLQQIKQQLPAQ